MGKSVLSHYFPSTSNHKAFVPGSVLGGSQIDPVLELIEPATMAPKSEINYDTEANSKREIPNDQVMADAGKVHLGTCFHALFRKI